MTKKIGMLTKLLLTAGTVFTLIGSPKISQAGFDFFGSKFASKIYNCSIYNQINPISPYILYDRNCNYNFEERWTLDGETGKVKRIEYASNDDRGKPGWFDLMVDYEYLEGGEEIKTEQYDTNRDGLYDKRITIHFDARLNRLSQTIDYENDGREDEVTYYDYEEDDLISSATYQRTNSEWKLIK
jgi:hypothetical protein